MKIKDLQITNEKERHFGDFVSFPCGNRFYIGVISENPEKNVYQVNVDVEKTFDGDESIFLAHGQKGLQYVIGVEYD